MVAYSLTFDGVRPGNCSPLALRAGPAAGQPLDYIFAVDSQQHCRTDTYAKLLEHCSSPSRLRNRPRESVEDRTRDSDRDPVHFGDASRSVPAAGRPEPDSPDFDDTLRLLSELGVPSLTASRSMSPVEMCRRWMLVFCQLGCLGPFPDPGGPEAAPDLHLPRSPANATSFHEAIVVAHQQVRLDLLQGVEGHAHHDQQARTAEVEAAR